MCKAGQLKSARELFHSLSNKGLQPDVKTYTIMIKGLFSEGLTSEVNMLLKVMEENRCSPNDFTYNTIIRGLIGNNEMSRAIQVFHEMVERGFSADASTAELLVDLLVDGKLDLDSLPSIQKLL